MSPASSLFDNMGSSTEKMVAWLLCVGDKWLAQAAGDMMYDGSLEYWSDIECVRV